MGQGTGIALDGKTPQNPARHAELHIDDAAKPLVHQVVDGTQAAGAIATGKDQGLVGGSSP